MRLDRDALVPILAASARVTACASPLRESLPASLSWTQTLWELGVERAPLFAVHDLGWILLQRNDFRLTRADPRRRVDDLAWRDRAVGRWLLDDSAREVHELLTATRGEERDLAVAHALSLCLPHALAEARGLPRGNPAHLRALRSSVIEASEGEADPRWTRRALDARAEVLRALPSGRLFSSEAIWEVAHRRALPSEAARRSMRALNGLLAGIPAPSIEVARRLRRGPRVEQVEGDDAGSHPAGGFDGITNRGALESLLRSEVALIGEGRDALGGVDLFDLRLAAGELSYYARDESPLIARRRALAVVFDRPGDLRVKRAALAAETLTLLEAAVVAAHRDLVAILGPRGARTEISWSANSERDHRVAEEERALLSIALAPELAHRRVRFDVEGPAARPRVVISAHPRPSGFSRDGWLHARGDHWRLDDRSVAAGDLGALRDALLDAVAAHRAG